MQTARRGTVAVFAAALAILLAAGCAGGGSTPEATTPPPGLADFDPPLAFGEQIWLGNGYQADAFHVAGAILYTYRRSPSTITTWDMATGTERETVAVDLEGGAPRTARDGSPYAFAEVDGRVSLLVAYEHFDPGVGTRPSQHLLRVRAYAADDGSLAWSRDVPETGAAEVRILAAGPDHTVVVTGAGNPATERAGRDPGGVEGATTVLDSGSGEVRRSWDPFVAYAVDRDVVAGLHPDPTAPASANQPAHALEGRHVATGETVWEDPDLLVSGADYFGYDVGGGVLLQPARSRGTASVVAGTLSTNLVLEIATGEVLLEIDHAGSAVACRHDGDQFLVCSHDPVDRAEPFLAAYDLHGRTLLWDQDAVGTGRDLPSTITAVHRGVVYMAYASSSRRPVALDARTGADLAVDLPLAPDQVGPGYGLTYADVGHISIYPATG